MTWTPWSALCPPPPRLRRRPSLRAPCLPCRPRRAPPPRGSSPTPTSSARSSASWWRRSGPTSKSVLFYSADRSLSHINEPFCLGFVGTSSIRCVPSGLSPTNRHIPSLTEDQPCLCFQDLSCLIERYLTPLQKESFLTQDEVFFTFFLSPDLSTFI